MEITVTVNGTAHTADVEPRTLLVQFIRETVGLTGTNIGCDTSSCGACSIHLDGEAVKSCTLLAVQADGSDVTTIEGMASPDGTLHPMQQAFMENHGLQCGYCTPGMVMAATSLLKENPNPSEDDVRIGLEGNLCRCTAFARGLADDVRETLKRLMRRQHIVIGRHDPDIRPACAEQLHLLHHAAGRRRMRPFMHYFLCTEGMCDN